MSLYTFWKAAGLEFFSRITSRKLWMVIFACSLPWLGLERGVNHLYALSPTQAGVYGGMFLAVMGGIVAIVCKYMGIENVSVSAATSAAALIQSAASHSFERREEKIEVDEKIVKDMEQRYKGDPSYRPIKIDVEETFR